MKAMDVIKPSPNTWKPKRASYTGYSDMPMSEAAGLIHYGSYPVGAAKQRPMLATIAYRKKVVEKRQEPPCDIDCDNQREQDSTALQHSIQCCFICCAVVCSKGMLDNPDIPAAEKAPRHPAGCHC